MLRRCTTPNPYSKSKYLNQLVDAQFCTQPPSLTPHVNYSTFSFVDKLNKNSTCLYKGGGDSLTLKKHQNIVSRVENIENKNNLINRHKTGAYQIGNWSFAQQVAEGGDERRLVVEGGEVNKENLKDKKFDKNKENVVHDVVQLNNWIQNTRSICSKNVRSMKKVHKNRALVSQYINNFCIGQFRKYAQGQPHKNVRMINPVDPNSKLIKEISVKMQENTDLQALVQQFLCCSSKINSNLSQSRLSSLKNKPNIRQNTTRVSVETDIFVKEENRLEQILFDHLKNKNKDFEYLIKPSESKQNYNKILSKSKKNKTITTTSTTSTTTSNKKPQYSEIQDLKQYKFAALASTISIKSNHRHQKWKTDSNILDLRVKQLMVAIETGSIYNFLYFVIRWPALLGYRDDQGNSLMHIAAKFNQGNILSMIVQKQGKSGLADKNNAGRTVNQIANLFASHDTVHIINQIQTNH